MKIITSFIFSALLTCTLSDLSAQSSLQTIFPGIEISDDANAKEIVLDELHVDIKVAGNLSTTTFTMRFLNTNDRILEGELTFPLTEGASVSRFAMDVNGIIREGVPVEKNKGQQVFETIERRQVDPGLLELVQGNTFRTRIYPIPANEYKTIVIAYHEILPLSESRRFFKLPLYFNKLVNKVSLHVEVLKQKQAPVFLNDNFTNFSFNFWDENYVAEAKYEKLLLNHQLSFAVPKTENTTGLYIEKDVKTNVSYFYLNTPIKELKREKQIPSKIAIFWDVSSSLYARNTNEELAVLANYFTKIGEGSIKLHLFSNTVKDAGEYQITNGTCPALIAKLKNLRYDGGTQLGVIDFNSVEADEIILFSDGLGTFGKNKIEKSNTPLVVINSSSKADHSLLRYLALSSAGTYINLQNVTKEEAIELITSQTMNFLGAEYSESIEEVYPSVPVPVSNSFSCAGILHAEKGSITLNFGFGKEIIVSKTIDIINENSNYGGIIEKAWANKKIGELDLLYEKNKEAITQLGKDFSIVTRNTSLIVLDAVEDYVQYKISPPLELLKEYNRLIAEQAKTQEESKISTIDRIAKLYQQKIDWWNTDFSRVADPIRNNDNPIDLSGLGYYAETSSMTVPEYSAQTKLLSGVVYGEDGLPIPGVTMLVKGTDIGTINDLDGEFSFMVPINAIIQYSFIGYRTVEQDVSGLSEVNVLLTPDDLGLEEVVVVGYGTSSRRERRNQSIVREAPESFDSMVEDESASYEMVAAKSKKRTQKEIKGAIYLKPWSPDAPYLKRMKGTSKNELYKTYMALKDEFKSTPSFYVDVSNLLFEKGLKEEALRVLSNLSEVQLSNHEILRVLAHKLEQMNEFELAITVYRKVLELRKEEPQSYRDLALVLAKNHEYQEAVDLLYSAILTDWDGRFPGIETIMVTEMNSIIAKAGRQVHAGDIDKRLLVNLPTDIRVVLNWDADNTDMDLWVTDPHTEKCFYQHKETRIGGQLSNDFTGGYGPEEFMLKKAIEGDFSVEAEFYGTSQQSIAGPVTIYLQLFTNFGKPNEQCKEIVVRLSTNKEIVKVGEFSYW